MPILNWIGKDKVVNHHQEVPYRVLEPRGTHGRTDSGNMIVHGDNLDALKALLPQLEGRVQLVYIDPPYNTGNENWVYNDNVNDPKMRKWLGEVVGKEGEDLNRHDKWLCMMYPRLKLIQRLLADDGVIFMSIDDNEVANLRYISDEIFGASCFVADVLWQRTYSTRNDSKGIVTEVEHLLVYGKQPDWQPNKLPRTTDMDAKYKNPDYDVMPWRSDNPYAPGGVTHQGMVYAIQHPFTGVLIYPTSNSHWRYQQSMMLEIMNGWCEYELRDMDDAKERAKICGIAEDEVRQGVMGIVLKNSIEESTSKAKQVLKRGQWPRFYFSTNGKGKIARKTYLDSVGGKLVTNFWAHTEVGHTDEAKKEILALFGGSSIFNTPKPTRLIQRILEICPNKKALVLDSFAGSGTTAHAVLNMNRRDGGKRRFILVEMEDYAESITAERLKRVIDGYGSTEGTGGGFAFYELGERLLLEDGNLNENIPVERIREYVWYTETRGDKLEMTMQNGEMQIGEMQIGEMQNVEMQNVEMQIGEMQIADCTNADCRVRKSRLQNAEWRNSAEDYLLGVRAGTAYYFYYEKARATVLDRGFLRGIITKAGGYLIYADINTLCAEEMDAANIRFKKIPRDITKI